MAMVMATVMVMGSHSKVMTNVNRATARETKVSPSEILRRLILLALVAILGWWSARSSFASVVKLASPTSAITAEANEPTALAMLADALFAKAASSKSDRGNFDEAASLARKSLRHQALNPKAMRILIFADPHKQSKPHMRSMANLASQLSQRELGTHVWLIEDYVLREDITGALKHYDLALSTSVEGRKALMPILIAAVDDARIRTALVPYIQRRRPWVYDFFSSALSGKLQYLSLAKLVEEAGGWPKDKSFEGWADVLMAQLVANGEIDVAKRQFFLRANADPRLLTSADLSSLSFSKRQQPFAWQALGSSSAGLNFIGNHQGGEAISIFAAANERMLVGRKLLMLTNGKYVLDFRIGDVLMDDSGSFRVILTCLYKANSFPILVRNFDRLRSGAKLHAEFQIPTGCDAQNLDLEIAGGQSQQGSEMIIKSISVADQAL